MNFEDLIKKTLEGELLYLEDDATVDTRSDTREVTTEPELIASINNVIEEKSEVEATEPDKNEEFAATPPSGRDEPRFTLKDVDEKFKSFIIRDPICILTGSMATQGKGADIDLIMRDEDLPEILQEAIRFRIYRMVAGEFNIPFDETPDIVHFHDEPFGSYTSYKNLYRLKVERIPEEEVHQMESCEIIEKSSDRIIGGIVSSDAIDLEGERMNPKFLEKLWNNIKSLPPEYLNLMIGHTSSQIGQLILEYNGHKSGLRDNKLYLIAKLRTDLELANDVWKAILAGKLHSFSIKVQIRRPIEENIKKVCNKNKCWTELLDGAFIEASLTANPSNMECDKLDILSKRVEII